MITPAEKRLLELVHESISIIEVLVSRDELTGRKLIDTPMKQRIMCLCDAVKKVECTTLTRIRATNEDEES